MFQIYPFEHIWNMLGGGAEGVLSLCDRAVGVHQIFFLKESLTEL